MFVLNVYTIPGYIVVVNVNVIVCQYFLNRTLKINIINNIALSAYLCLLLLLFIYAAVKALLGNIRMQNYMSMSRHEEHSV